ncbi:MAG: phosphatase PAP2 family protein [Solirubrobacterales bacterium]|nr:phosphatase PAP2 family protein [Solirubrobacterales bacterium]
MAIRPRNALLGVAACVVALALVWLGAFHVGFVRRADQSAFLQFYNLKAHGIVEWLVQHLIWPFLPTHYAFVAPVPIVLALVRGRRRVVLAMGVIILGANASTELLKALLTAPRPAELLYGFAPVPPGSWPSGHATAVMSLVLVSVLAVPARVRPTAAALGATLAIAVGYSVVAAGLHYPSDVLGGFLMAGAWTLAAVAGLILAERRWPVARASSGAVSLRAVLGAPGAVLLGGGLLGVILLIARPHHVISYASVHQAFMLEAVAIAALGLAVSTAVLLSVRR